MLGLAAPAVLSELVAGKPVTVTVTANFHKVYDLDLTRLSVNERDVGSASVSDGHAWSSRLHYSPGPCAAQEASARLTRLGLLAGPAAQLARDFRKQHGLCQPPR